MKYFIDTEFIESGPEFPLILLSVAIVAENGREFYVVNEDAPLELASDWVKKNVIPQLGGPKLGITHIGPAILRWMTDPKPEFWGYYADYDWVVFCQLYGTMIKLPKGWPMYCRDLKQWSDQVGAPKFEAPKGEHNALTDAKWNVELYRHIENWARRAAKANGE